MSDRAQDYIIGQLTGDVLGRRVQFQPPEKICRNHPDGARNWPMAAHEISPPGRYRVPAERLTAVVHRVPEMETVLTK